MFIMHVGVRFNVVGTCSEATGPSQVTLGHLARRLCENSWGRESGSGARAGELHIFIAFI